MSNHPAEPAYQLLDFGKGRKLERFGSWIFDRPSPSAHSFTKRFPKKWKDCDFYFELQSSHKGQWFVSENVLQNLPSNSLPNLEPNFSRSVAAANRKMKLPEGFEFQIDCGSLILNLKCTEFGHLGIFPEHFQHWNRVAPLIEAASQSREINILTLFAYTGASSLLMASKGAMVTHVEAAKNTTNWARINAQSSKLQDKPIRWIVDDVPKFVAREIKRKKLYDGIILDPPTFGRGSKGQVWKIADHLPALMDNLCKILSPNALFLMLSTHSEGFEHSALNKIAKDSLRNHYTQLHGQMKFSPIFMGPVGIQRNSDSLNQSFLPSSEREGDCLPAGSVVCFGKKC